MRRVLVVALTLSSACATAPAPRPSRIEVRSELSTPHARSGDREEGLASWYGGKHHGGPTASGEQFDMNDLTAAHKTLRMHTRVRVTNKLNGRSVVVRINDRGPYAKGRIIDLSRAAAIELDMIDRGVAPVFVEILRP